MYDTTSFQYYKPSGDANIDSDFKPWLHEFFSIVFAFIFAKTLRYIVYQIVDFFAIVYKKQRITACLLLIAQLPFKL